MKPVADPPKQRLFIYDRKEMAVLTLLGLMVALFAFTLGVHLGKKVNPGQTQKSTSDGVAPARTEPDQVPDNPEIVDQTVGAPEAVDEKLDQALQEEVSKTGIKLNEPRQVDLPKDAKSGAGGATTPAEAETAPVHTEKPAARVRVAPKQVQNSKDSFSAFERAAPKGATGKYTLQVGSHRIKEEAESQIRALEIQGLKPFARAVDLKQKGHWHRVFIGGFATQEDAERAGGEYRADGFIESFVVAPRPN
jgi:cell division protein FtsN